MIGLLASRPPVLGLFTRLRKALLLAFVMIAPIAVIVTGTDATDWWLFAVIYPFQAVGGGISLHRYFAHRSFRTSRVFQFALALMSAITFGDPIRFTGKHRLHHRHVDKCDDPHTPSHGFWSCAFGSMVDTGYTEQQVRDNARDLTRYPELMWLHRFWMLPGLLLSGLAYWVNGFSGIAIGVLLGVSILIYQSVGVNYFSHRYGQRRFDTADQSSNNWLVAVISYGEGWHNNHHFYPSSARAGFRWWEIDMNYWLICLWEKLGLVWAVRRPPEYLPEGLFAAGSSNRQPRG